MSEFERDHFRSRRNSGDDPRPPASSRGNHRDSRQGQDYEAGGSRRREDRVERSKNRDGDLDSRPRRDQDSKDPRDRHDDDRRHERRERARRISRDNSHDDRRSRSPPSKRRRRSHSISQSPPRKSRAPLPSQVESFRGDASADGEKPPEKRKPNYKPTGLLAKEANTVAGTTTVLRYHEPPEGRKPPTKQQWRLFVFKKNDLVDTVLLYTRSCWLVGRDKKVTDLLVEHPSISKQHAVIQFRHQTSTNEYGDKSSKVKPYVIDLESANGTRLNGKAIDATRFVELVDGDSIVFGESEREYTLMLPPP